MIVSILNIIIGALAFLISSIDKKHNRQYVLIIATLMIIFGIIGVFQERHDEKLIKKTIHTYGTIIDWSQTEIHIKGIDLDKFSASTYIAVLKIFPSNHPSIKRLKITSRKGYSLNEIYYINLDDTLALMSLLADKEGKIEVKKEYYNKIDTIYFSGKYEKDIDSIVLKPKEIFIHPRIYKSLAELEGNYIVLLIADKNNPKPRWYGWAYIILKTNIGKEIIPMGFKVYDPKTKKIYNNPIRIIGGKIPKGRFLNLNI